MGDFDDGYEKGYWDLDGIPIWIEDDENYDISTSEYTHSDYYEKSNFKIDSFNEHIIKLYIDLTPINFLNENQKIIRDSLKEIKNTKVDLTIKLNKNNVYDNKALEVYYQNTFIGYVRKKYQSSDYSNYIENYCLYKNKLDSIQLEYIDGKFILSKPISLISDQIIGNIAADLTENEKFLIDIWKWAIKYRIKSIPFDKKQLLNLDYFECDQKVALEKSIFKLPNLSAISLEEMELSYLPNEIGSLINIDTMYLSNNNLSKLPHSLKKLINLKTIYLDNNKFREFPEILFSLPNIELLSLENNNLTIIPNEISKMINIKDLNLGENNLSTLPNTIGNLSNLKKLTLWHNNLILIPNELSNLINLEEIYLNDNQLTQLPSTLSNLKNLRTKYIHNNIVYLEWPGEETKKYEIVFFILGLIVLLWIASNI